MQTKFHFIFIPLTFVILLACSDEKVKNNGIYYWKSKTENQAVFDNLNTFKINKLYLKVFEVEISGGEIIPIDKTDFNTNKDSLSNVEIIPCVFIQNDVLKELCESKPDSEDFQWNCEKSTDLSDKIVHLINKKFEKRKFKEIQIDCDWTPSTKEIYFNLLKKIKIKSNKILSCTLRLYPYKYPDKMGIPPVDKVTLMCYNLVSAIKNPTKNSILDLKELQSYMTKNNYSKPIDIVLPIYSWSLIFDENKKFLGVFHESKRLNSILKTKNKLWKEITKDTLVENHYLREGFLVKEEKIDYKILKEAVNIIKNNVKIEENSTISLFHLDQNNLKNFTNEQIDSLYTAF